MSFTATVGHGRKGEFFIEVIEDTVMLDGVELTADEAERLAATLALAVEIARMTPEQRVRYDRTMAAFKKGRVGS